MRVTSLKAFILFHLLSALLKAQARFKPALGQRCAFSQGILTCVIVVANGDGKQNVAVQHKQDLTATQVDSGAKISPPASKHACKQR